MSMYLFGNRQFAIRQSIMSSGWLSSTEHTRQSKLCHALGTANYVAYSTSGNKRALKIHYKHGLAD